jgi:hypothetical protein
VELFKIFFEEAGLRIIFLEDGHRGHLSLKKSAFSKRRPKVIIYHEKGHKQ